MLINDHARFPVSTSQHVLDFMEQLHQTGAFVSFFPKTHSDQRKNDYYLVKLFPSQANPWDAWIVHRSLPGVSVGRGTTAEEAFLKAYDVFFAALLELAHV